MYTLLSAAIDLKWGNYYSIGDTAYMAYDYCTRRNDFQTAVHTAQDMHIILIL